MWTLCLSSALKENNQILGVIYGVKVNQGFRSTSIMQLNVESQCSLFEQLCLQSRTDPQCVSIIETHGTGTQVGDECETESVSPAFKPPTCSPSIEVASGTTRLAKLLPTFHKDSRYCQRTPSCAISLMSTLSLVRHSYPTAVRANLPSALNMINASSVGKLVQLVTASRLILYHEGQIDPMKDEYPYQIKH